MWARKFDRKAIHAFHISVYEQIVIYEIPAHGVLNYTVKN